MNKSVARKDVRERILEEELHVSMDENLARILGWNGVPYDINGNPPRVIGFKLYKGGINLLLVMHEDITKVQFTTKSDEVIRWFFERRRSSFERELIKYHNLKRAFFGSNPMPDDIYNQDREVLKTYL